MKKKSKNIFFIGLISSIASPLAWSNLLSGVSITSTEATSHEMIVKFKAGSISVVQSNKIILPESNQPSPSQNNIINLHYTPIFDQVAKPIASNSSKDLSSLSGMMAVDISELNLEEMEQLCVNFEKLNEIEYCSLSPIFSPFGNDLENIAPPASTPPSAVTDLYSRQEYFHNSNAHSINAEYAWNLGLSGKNVTLRDAEWAMDVQHEDFVGADLTIGLAQTKNDYSNHGTAVMGVLISQDNGWGTRGSVPDAKASFYSENTGRTFAIAKMIQDASAGDILILEMQTNGCDSKLSTPDYPSAIWDLVKGATDNDILVVMAAGNGASNLDAACYSSYRARGDNGAIIVGAGVGQTRGRKSFSTYGAAVDLMGWGSGVTTLDYGDAYNGGVHAKYTHTFNGTSSATPIVASAMALVQDFAKEKMGRFLKPIEMRTLLVSTGKPQLLNLTTPIGPLPDVKAAIEKLAADNGIDLTGNSSITQSSAEMSSIEVSSSITLSSVQNKSSATQSSNCEGVPLYADAISVGGVYQWGINSGSKVIYNNHLWTAVTWSNLSRKNPEQAGSALFVNGGECLTTLSSSENILSSSIEISSNLEISSQIFSSIALSSIETSSSSDLLSSSEFITTITLKNSVEISSINKNQISLKNTTISKFKLYNSQGVLLQNGLIQGSSFTWKTPLSQGVYFIKIQKKISRFSIK